MGPALIRKERVNNEDIIKPIAILPNVIELTYYSNTVTTFYALESIIAIALDSLDTSSGYIAQRDLVESTLDLCNILQYEFIFCKPCQNLEAIVLDCIDNLVFRREIFHIVSMNNNLCNKLKVSFYCIVCNKNYCTQYLVQ